MPASRPVAQDSSSRFLSVRVTLFSLVLACLWAPVNTLLLPDRVGALAGDGMRGTTLGLFTFIGVGIAALYQPIAGRITDCWQGGDRRRPFLLFPSFAIVPLVVLLGWAPTLIVVLAAYIALQIAANTVQAASQPLIADAVPSRRRGSASGLKIAFNVIGTVLGLAVAGALLGRGPEGVLAAAAIGALVAVTAFIAVVMTPAVEPVANEGGTCEEFAPKAVARTAITALRTNQLFRSLVLTRFVLLIGVYPIQQLLVFALEDRYNIEDPGRAATPYLAGAVIIVVASAAVAGVTADRVGGAVVMRTSIAVAAVGVLGVAVSPVVPMLVGAGIVLAIGFGAFQVANWKMLNDAVPGAEAGQHLAVANVATAGASALAGLAGLLVDFLNTVFPLGTYPITFGLAGILTAISLLAARDLGPQSQHHRAAPAAG